MDYKALKQRYFSGSKLYRLGCLDFQHPVTLLEGVINLAVEAAKFELARQRRESKRDKVPAAHLRCSGRVLLRSTMFSISARVWTLT